MDQPMDRQNIGYKVVSITEPYYGEPERMVSLIHPISSFVVYEVGKTTYPSRLAPNSALFIYADSDDAFCTARSRSRYGKVAVLRVSYKQFGFSLLHIAAFGADIPRFWAAFNASKINPYDPYNCATFSAKSGIIYASEITVLSVIESITDRNRYA